MAHAGPVTFTLRAGPLAAADLWVARVEGRERLSEPYAFVVDFWPLDGEPFDVEAVLGREALLTMRREAGEERLVHGEAHVAELVSIAAGRPRYRITIAPKMARLGLGSRSRVFQEQTVAEIVDAVLTERGVAHRLDLAGKYPKREMVIQHRESDLAFVSRLLEAEGIWYRFEHAEDGHELVIADGRGAYVEAEGAVLYRPDGERGGGTGHVWRLDRTSRLVPAAAAARDFDFERPLLDLGARAKEGDGPEVYEWPGGYRASGEGKRLVSARLEELRFGAETFEGRGTSLLPAPGIAFEVEEHPKLLAVGVVHRGEQEKSDGRGEGVVRERARGDRGEPGVPAAAANAGAVDGGDPDGDGGGSCRRGGAHGPTPAGEGAVPLGPARSGSSSHGRSSSPSSTLASDAGSRGSAAWQARRATGRAFVIPRTPPASPGGGAHRCLRLAGCQPILRRPFHRERETDRPWPPNASDRRQDPSPALCGVARR